MPPTSSPRFRSPVRVASSGTQEEMLRSEKTERAPGTIGGMSNRSGSWVTYKTQQYSWASPITDEERIEAKDNPGIDLESERADDCLATVLLAREVRAAALLAAAASYEAANIKACPADARWNKIGRASCRERV